MPPVYDKPDIGDIRDNPPPPPVPPAQAAPIRLPLPGQAEIIEQVHSGLGSPITLAYGRHVVGGHLIFQQDIGSSTTVMVFSLGEGEWDAIEWLEVNGARVDHTNTAIVHFHPGLDGEIGTETTPAVRNQKYCSLLPSTFTPAMHWPRTAYLVLKLPFDPESPTDGFQVRASYKCLRVRQFDNAGTQTAYSYSANPAWCALDAILRGYLKTRSAINEALTTAEKARFDWPAWKAWADACSATVGGEARWESHLPFVQQSDLRAALDWMLMVGRAYLIEKDGKLAPFHDEAGASAATYDASDFLDGSLNLARRSVRNRANRHSLAYRDIDSGVAPGTLASAGTALTGTDTDFARRLQEAKMVRLLDGAQAGEVRSIVSVSDDTNAVLDAAFGANQSTTAYESPNDSYQQQTRQFDDEDHQDEIGRIITQRIDVGNSIPARAERLLAYIRARAGLSKLTSGRIGFGVPGALDHLPGDLVTLPAGQDFASTQVTELLEVTVDPNFSVTLAGIEYSAAIFIDSAGDQELIVPLWPGRGKFTRILKTATDGSGKVDLSSADILNRTLEFIADSGVYGRVKLTGLTTGQVDLSKSGVLNRTLANIADTASWKKTTPNEKTGADRGFNTLTSDLLVKTANYHQSALRDEATTVHGGSTFTAGGVWVTVGSFTFVKPLGVTQYKGPLTISFTNIDATTWTIKGRIHITGAGTVDSNELSFTNPANSTSGTVTATGLTSAKATITISVQINLTHDGTPATSPGTANFTQTEYTDQGDIHA